MSTKAVPLLSLAFRRFQVHQMFLILRRADLADFLRQERVFHLRFPSWRGAFFQHLLMPRIHKLHQDFLEDEIAASVNAPNDFLRHRTVFRKLLVIHPGDNKTDISVL